ncbi:class I SAM-dependent methyltransferase [Robertmurraya sp. DFI.2.37]|uniref:class I SAM-dependent DNA methyltransferase n=1 Tax=Robertmurraya sp. DFI.2.37 TaxID=3031819 RepID=UPI001247B93D|nr:class I SAM-dependent methyltransferase [Robertmurraya sp. DFI.2.37]MDF1508285.1 class I SAM-dependent methyltransferase [Robertmurraya sp. DFI.2.37]
MTYERFAYLYDELMKDVPYEQWVRIVNDSCQKYNVSGKKLLDLACGTGELSLRLQKNGYTVSGVDLSADMLTVAQAKAVDEGLAIDFFQQNMVELDLLTKYDVIGIFCDSLNYLQTEEEVKQTFHQIKQFLKKDGLLIFDVHSLYKINEIFLNETFTYDDGRICYIWNCFAGEYPHSVEHELTFFVEDSSGKYERIDENHTQRSFALETYEQWLTEAGFTVLETIGDFAGEPQANSERVFFVVAHK